MTKNVNNLPLTTTTDALLRGIRRYFQNSCHVGYQTLSSTQKKKCTYRIWTMILWELSYWSCLSLDDGQCRLYNKIISCWYEGNLNICFGLIPSVDTRFASVCTPISRKWYQGDPPTSQGRDDDRLVKGLPGDGISWFDSVGFGAAGSETSLVAFAGTSGDGDRDRGVSIWALVLRAWALVVATIAIQVRCGFRAHG